MQAALRLTARVQAGHKLEVVAPELREGEEVMVVIMSSETFAPSSQEDRISLAQHLLAQGAISSIPTGRSGLPPQPILVQGQPVSETIVEERG